MISDIVPEMIPELLTKRDRWGAFWAEYDEGTTVNSGNVNPLTDRRPFTKYPETWTSFEETCEFAADSEKEIEAFEFASTARDPFAQVLLQHSVEPETNTLTDWAQIVVEQLDSYTELHPVHDEVLIVVEADDFLPNTYPPETGGSIMISSSYNIPLTGNHLDGTPTQITERSDALRGLFEVYNDAGERYTIKDIGEGVEETVTRLRETHAADLGKLPKPVTEVTLTTEEIIEHAHQGPRSRMFTQLWTGNTKGYPSPYEADVALACHFAYWTGGDGAWMYRLLWRSDTHERRKMLDSGQPYWQSVIERACDLTDDYYEHSTSLETETPATRMSIAELDPIRDVETTDDELIEQIMNSTHGEWFAALWQGEQISPAHTETWADTLLCNELAYFTGGDALQIDRLFRKSGRMRDKWDESIDDGNTYGAKLIIQELIRRDSFHKQMTKRLIGW